MAHKEHLEKVGQDGFAMLKECKRGRLTHVTHEIEVQNPSPCPNSINFLAIPRTLDCNQAAKKYGGVVVKDFRRKFRI